MQTIHIDGNYVTGRYRVDCDCRQNWSGHGEVSNAGSWNPALPLAEAVVHNRESHPEQKLDLVFAPAFLRWLRHYWDEVSLRRATLHHETRE